MRSMLKPLFVTTVTGAMAMNLMAQTDGITNAPATPAMAPATNAANPPGASMPPAGAMPAPTVEPSPSVFSSNIPLGIGFSAGEPTGLSLKYWLTEKFAVDAGGGYSFANSEGFQMYSDFLFHKFDLIHVPRGELPLYFGVGGRLKFPEHGDNIAGLRLPVGLSYLFPDTPLELFAEVAPIVDVSPVGELRWNGGIGLRYYFW